MNAIRPGHPAIFGTWCFVSDLRTGAMSGGSPEQALLSAAAGQMANFHDLTGGTASGMSDSKIADGQAGAEKGLNHALVGNAGVNLIYESAGMHASLLGFSPESLVIDNDIIGMTQRTSKGIEVNEERLSFETIKDVCLNGPGHYLGSGQTLQLMQTEYLYPSVGDRKSPNEWVEQGSTDIIARAARKVSEILVSHYPKHIPEAIGAAIRARFPVKLPRESMAAGASARAPVTRIVSAPDTPARVSRVSAVMYAHGNEASSASESTSSRSWRRPCAAFLCSPPRAFSSSSMARRASLPMTATMSGKPRRSATCSWQPASTR